MSPALDEALVKDFPLLYTDRNASQFTTAMNWGFECGDGWEPLIRQASEKLELLIVDYIKENPKAEFPPRASQIKEKYGSLRFYMTGTTDAMDKIISRVETKSEKTCETCGNPGKIRGKGWYYTACDEHTKEKDRAT